MAARSSAVGSLGFLAGGRLPSFINVAIRSNRALVELRLEAPMKGPLLAEKPSVLPRPLKTTGMPLYTARVTVRLPCGHVPECDHTAKTPR